MTAIWEMKSGHASTYADEHAAEEGLHGRLFSVLGETNCSPALGSADQP